MSFRIRFRENVLATSALALMVAGCDQTGMSSQDTASMFNNASSVASDRFGPAKSTGMPVGVSFIDGDVFDRQLSSAMKANPSQVLVDYDAPANQLPLRLNTWFNEVSDRGGKVSTMTEDAWNRVNNEQTAQTRAFFLLQLLPFLFSYIQDRLHQEAMYGPSRNYDAVLVTNQERNHVKMLVFRHRDRPTRTLVTPDEASQGAYQGPSAITTRGLGGPKINVTSPQQKDDSALPVLTKPVHIAMNFVPATDSRIDLSSLKVIYLKLFGIDITDRVRPYIVGDGIDVPQADIPIGQHSIRVEIKDSMGRGSSEVFRFAVR